ncbi:MAG: hypothetical protein LBQ00_08360 [Syntrophobacterales bacterium]|nr:hypothetical protein [Syntrophobacterales bacterium]
MVPDRLGKIFDEFGQTEGAAGYKTYSEGLGFTFYKLVVETHGGRVGMESTPGNGSTFWFEFTRNP